MEIEVFTLCDFAQDNGGKLTIVGTFDSIGTTKIPATHPSCCIATRLRFSEKETGDHTFKLRLINTERKELIPPIEGNINVRTPPNGQYGVINIVGNLNNLTFEKAGRYSFELYVDEEWKSGLPLIIYHKP